MLSLKPKLFNYVKILYSLNGEVTNRNLGVLSFHFIETNSEIIYDEIINRTN